jgi:hypothetical protein
MGATWPSICFAWVSDIASSADCSRRLFLSNPKCDVGLGVASMAGLKAIPDGDWYCELCCRNFGISSYGHSAMSGLSKRKR